ncbi:MAG: type VI secretion system baseplate subunit TssG [Pseudomonadota bacterium]
METGNGPQPADLRPNDAALRAALEARPETYHLFHALRIVDAAQRAQPRLGETRRPREDSVRLGQEAELAFPPSTLAGIKRATGKRPPLLINRFFGLFGPHGPLPLHLTEFARNRERHDGDRTFIAFADMLIHRLMTLFYRAWSAAEPAPSHDREDDSFSAHVSALAGIRGAHLQARDAMPDLAKQHFAGVMGRGVKTAEGLRQIVSAFFEAPVRVEQFVGSWLELEPEDCWALGAGGLGQSTMLGSRVWSRTSKFRLMIGPLSLEDYRRLLPGGDALARLRAIVRNYIGDVLDWDVNLILRADAVPAPVMGQAMPLGHTSWIGSEPHARDADDLFLHPPTP